MRRIIAGAAFTLLASATFAASPNRPIEEDLPVMDRIAELQEAGRLDEADALTRAELERRSFTPDQRRALQYELERSRRIRMDYTVTEDALFTLAADGIRDLTRDEFNGWIEEGRLDFKVIDGERLFVGSSYSNLFHRDWSLDARRAKPASAEWEDFLWAHVRALKAEKRHTAQDTLSPHHFRITMTNVVRGGVVPEGDLIRCWMVYPQQYKAQSGVVLEAASPEPTWINAPDYPHRSLYFEQPSRGDEPTTFTATYTLTTHPRSIDVDPAVVAAHPQGEHPEAAWFLREQPPHVVFRAEVRRLAAEIVGDETNPAIKARLIYDWIAHNMKYSYAREYSTLRNISHYSLTNRYGDCGQLTLLYITLCRASGVPARWQSGWVIYPRFQNLHDWCEILIEPYGWVPVDPNFGLMPFTPDFAHLTDVERDEIHDFFFGGLDAYRMVVNRDHGAPHYPAKEDFRSDNVDFQRGELEANGRNLYFDEFRYRMRLQVLDGPSGAVCEDCENLATGPATPGLAR